MRPLLVSTIISLDGRHEGVGGDVLALPFDEGFSAYNVERLRAAGTLLLGRRTYEGFANHWPPVADDETAPSVEREISRLNGAIDKVVVSDTLTLDPAHPWTATTRVVPREQAVATVGAMKDGEGGDILVFGSATTWNALLVAGLVDELHAMVGPALLGGGTAVYQGPERIPLRLLGARMLPGSQLILARYDATGARPGDRELPS